MVEEHTLWIEKYRPQSLEEFSGQEIIKQRVKALIEQKSIPHLLFAGPAGVGGHGRVDRTGPGALVAGGAQRGAAVGLGQGTQAAVAAGAGQAFARVMRIFWDGRQLCVESSA